MATIRKSVIDFAEFLAAIGKQYDDLINAVPSISYPLRKSADQEIYSLALAVLVSNVFGGPYEQAVTDFVSAAFNKTVSPDTVRKRLDRRRPKHRK